MLMRISEQTYGVGRGAGVRCSRNGLCRSVGQTVTRNWDRPNSGARALRASQLLYPADLATTTSTVVPASGELLTTIDPRCAAATRLAIARPSPVPPGFVE